MSTPIEQLIVSPISKLYKEHIGFIKAKNVDGLLNQYADDALLISTLTEDRQPLYVQGRQALKEFFESRIFGLEDFEIRLNQWAETENTLMMVEELKTTSKTGEVGSVEFYDNWFLQNGKIAIHFAGVIQYPDKTYVNAGTTKTEVPTSPLGKFYKEHIGFIKAKNVDGLLNQYAEDVLLISTLTENRKPIYVRGRQALKEFFESRIFSLEDFEVKLDQWAETENTLMIVESLKTRSVNGDVGEVSFYDNWVVRDRKIAVHFAGVIQYPDGSYA
ncbi:nuclear transport factor 2 family protein [Nostoc flagelliforme]|uniref:nuclear transport factor 2 family protein n=1 Tax=Nostoc flagelliforme TaxID=1306274 RepID=UPI0018EF4064|nr:nuclear transport factor 2 family protein [Nostoc flagelliforme]